MSDPQTKEFRVTMQLRNNRMIELREARGWTQKEAALFCLVPHQIWSGLETLRLKPTRMIGHYTNDARVIGWSKDALKVAEAMDASPEWLWPKEVQEVGEGRRRHLNVGTAEAKSLMGGVEASPELVVDEKALQLQVRTVLTSLSPREEKILRMRFGIGENSDHTLEEVGQELGISRRRTQQIEAKALSKLRHPSQNKKLKEFAPTKHELWLASHRANSKLYLVDVIQCDASLLGIDKVWHTRGPMTKSAAERVRPPNERYRVEVRPYPPCKCPECKEV